ncbi:MAG: hypothetical protein M1832_004020 [Thelocarpon impressellum]|nr:MAG: hypothetical protein M1832_004020 [Thelocarpon impressellum]
MVTPGGEVAFITRMLAESAVLKQRVQWYTSMVGKLSSLFVLIAKLKEQGVSNWAVKEFAQGAKTRRWGVAWSWGGLRPAMSVARGIPSLPKHLLPFPSLYSFHVPNASRDAAGQRVHATLEPLEPFRWQWRPALHVGVGFARQNVWSRASRRKQQRAADAEEMDEGDDEDEEAALGIKVTVEETERGNVKVKVRWLRGDDAVLYESFCGMLNRKVLEA